MKCVVTRNGRVHRVLSDSDGWPEGDFTQVADDTDVLVGDVVIDGAYVRPGSADALRYADNQARVDARIAAMRASLRGKSVSGMTAAERVDLIVILARALGVEVRP